MNLSISNLSKTYPNGVQELKNVALSIPKARQRKELVDALLHQTNLYEALMQNIRTFPGGMKSRFGIVQALLGNPKLIIADGPTAGLDPAERNRFHNLLSEKGYHENESACNALALQQ